MTNLLHLQHAEETLRKSSFGGDVGQVMQKFDQQDRCESRKSIENRGLRMRS